MGLCPHTLYISPSAHSGQNDGRRLPVSRVSLSLFSAPPWGSPWVKCGREWRWVRHPLTTVLHDVTPFMVPLPWFRPRVLSQCCVQAFPPCYLRENGYSTLTPRWSAKDAPPTHTHVADFSLLPLADLFLLLSPFQPEI